ncbi:ATP-binding cassette domain-containing protein [Streptomyces platensis]|uniref:ATP-binding cassette domain-containing protein n=1 Tax=Streptomyces platensis TaxID=58346 RepID=A0AAE6NEQ5_STRPT|nr:putative osmoprotectant uptake system substrate-binding protein OsmF precursor [Streptomyces platensis]QEV50525.1 ATP-binding cassette domain-containing protein [Streptomyces platensis]
MADSAEIVEPTSPASGAVGPGGSARSAGPDRPAAAGASIRPDNLTKRCPDSQAPAVEDVTRDEAAGETVTLVGPSDCGKSTTLKMINRLIEPASGQSTIGGEGVTGINPVGLRRTIVVRTAVAGALLLAAAGLSGCGLTSGSPMADSVQPGSIGKGRPLNGAQLTVTSKEFTEQIVLGQIMGLVFKAAGAEVLDRTNIQGSIGAREAVKSGAADGMYEYTGTAWITYLGHTKRVVDPYEQWEAVREEDRRNGVTWLHAAPLNNTYALVSNQANAQKYRLRTLSDVARLTKKDPGAATICGGSEFSVREDGLPGVAKTYGFALRRGNFKKMDDGVVYTQVAEGSACALGVAATTDGRIPELKLKVLEDDRHFFPNYNAAPEMNSATMRKYPAIADLLAPITKRLTGAEAQRLNARVDVDGEDPHEVAKDWLVREGFIREG